jgi:Zn-finger domain-containing protein
MAQHARAQIHRSLRRAQEREKGQILDVTCKSEKLRGSLSGGASFLTRTISALLTIRPLSALANNHYTWQIDAFIAPCAQYTLKRGRSLTLLQCKCVYYLCADRQMAPVCLQIDKAAKSAAAQLKN